MSLPWAACWLEFTPPIAHLYLCHTVSRNDDGPHARRKHENFYAVSLRRRPPAVGSLRGPAFRNQSNPDAAIPAIRERGREGVEVGGNAQRAADHAPARAST